MADNEERLARLEEGQYFQEQKLDGLDTALLEQQSRMDILEKRLAMAEERLASLLSHSDAGGGEASLPPHFMPERY